MAHAGFGHRPITIKAKVAVVDVFFKVYFPKATSAFNAAAATGLPPLKLVLVM